MKNEIDIFVIHEVENGTLCKAEIKHETLSIVLVYDFLVPIKNSSDNNILEFLFPLTLPIYTGCKQSLIMRVNREQM